MQTESQSVYEHGLSVQNHTIEIINILNGLPTEYKLPNWFIYKEYILKDLLNIDIIKEYTLFHDIGKPYCKTIDEFGKQHFLNHAEKSYEVYYNLTKNQLVSDLIRNDMKIHTMKLDQLDDFITNYKHLAPTLLVVAFAEIISNSKMFGGFDSVSYKIKFKQINKIGKNICNKLYGEIK